MSPGNPFILVSKVKGQGHEAQNSEFLHSWECWLFILIVLT